MHTKCMPLEITFLFNHIIFKSEVIHNTVVTVAHPPPIFEGKKITLLIAEKRKQQIDSYS